MSLFKVQRVRVRQRAIRLLATVALIWQTVQSVCAAGFDVNLIIELPDTSADYRLEGDGAIVTSNGAGPGVGFQDIITDLTDSPFWDIDVGIKTATWDHRHISFDDVTKFDGVKDFQVVLRATHKQGPHAGVEQLAPQTHDAVKGKPKRSRNDSNIVLRGTAHINGTHAGHRDTVTADLRFRVKKQNNATTLQVGDIILDRFAPAGEFKDLIVTAHHRGSGERVAAGPTFGSTQTSVSFISEGSDMLIIFPGPNDIVSSDDFRTTAGTGSHAGDSVVGNSLPSLMAVRTGFNNGIHSFTPTFDQFTFAAGDSIMHGTWDGFEIDTATGLAQARISEFHYTEGWDETGEEDLTSNPSTFMGLFVDRHLLDESSTTGELIFAWDATTLLNDSNNFQQESFGMTPFTLTGATIVPEPAALSLISMGMLVIAFRLPRRAS